MTKPNTVTNEMGLNTILNIDPTIGQSKNTNVVKTLTHVENWNSI
jgi:hypothetical protein